jgi:hypothetical protein
MNVRQCSCAPKYILSDEAGMPRSKQMNDSIVPGGVGEDLRSLNDIGFLRPENIFNHLLHNLKVALPAFHVNLLFVFCDYIHAFAVQAKFAWKH